MLFFAFLCWTLNALIRKPEDVIKRRMEQIKAAYAPSIQAARTPVDRAAVEQQLKAEIEIEEKKF